MWNQTLNLKKETPTATDNHPDYRKNFQWAQDWIKNHASKFIGKFEGLGAILSKEVVHFKYTNPINANRFATPIPLHQPHDLFLNQASRVYEMYLSSAKQANQMKQGDLYDNQN